MIHPVSGQFKHRATQLSSHHLNLKLVSFLLLPYILNVTAHIINGHQKTIGSIDFNIKVLVAF